MASIYEDELNEWWEEMYPASPASVVLGLGGSAIPAVMGDATVMELPVEGGVETVVTGVVFVRVKDVQSEPKRKTEIRVDGRPGRVVSCVTEANDPIYKIFYERRF